MTIRRCCARQRLISQAGFRVVTFERPSELLKSDLPKANACLVIDVDLPEMNGVELARKLAASGCSLPVIFITAHVDQEIRKIALDSCPVALLSKPFGRDELLTAIDSALHFRTAPAADLSTDGVMTDEVSLVLFMTNLRDYSLTRFFRVRPF